MVTLDPKVEQEIMSSVKQTEQGAYLTLAPERTKAIMASVQTEIDKLESLGKIRSLLLHRSFVCILNG